MTIDFFFDFLSPYAYLARHRLAEVAALHGCAIAYKPIDLARAKLAIGNTGPANRDMPVKLAYVVEDLKRWAARYRIPIEFIKNFNTKRMNVGTFYAEARGQQADYVRQAYHLAWGEGGAPDDDAALRSIAVSMGWDAADFLRFLDSSKAETAYNESTLEAISAGVFGVPTMAVGRDMWWGNDRIDFLETHLGRIAR
ncbi:MULTISPECIES: 2-hydroxychromene-2-carboxylate isomerase [Burkholderiaceae]|uniref:2-hydroxychromene-2-carboxylate isomerase n=1 Tax=Caballeronia udeis TaxID=1232866 RepID=A0A158GIX9_9BURK|nr:MULTISPECIES: 2-hydroxychromene-2-carboxylate isomerase [Burkholderiaceae]MBB5547759.1 2-hydroxychromene-2-carboxylate isomerase [Paraburkholderia fungorum]SAL31873.1 DSBA oxidoreductase [Caballeronia udeis]